MNKIKLITFVLLTQFTLFLNAANVDLKISIEIAKIDNISFGEIVPISLTLTNLGPDIAAGDSNDLYPNYIIIHNIYINEKINKRELVLVLDDSSLDKCLIFPTLFEPPVHPNDPKERNYEVVFKPLMPGETISCDGTLQVFIGQNQKEFNFTGAVFDDTDINPLNDVQKITLRLKPKTIPASNMISLLILFVSVLLVVLFRARKLKMQ